MAVPPSIIDPFHKKVYAILAEDIDNKMISLCSGAVGGTASGNQNDLAAIAIGYREQVAYINALNDVLKRCAEIEREQYGARPGADETATGE